MYNWKKYEGTEYEPSNLCLFTAPMCDCYVIFLIDVSGSIITTEFDEIINCVMAIVNVLNNFNTGFCYGAIKFGDDSEVVFTLEDGLSGVLFLEDFPGEVTNDGGLTHTDQGINDAIMEFNEL